MYAIENWITAALLCHARSFHDDRVTLRQARFHTVVSFELAGRAVAAIGGQWPPVTK
jgi:hypothetical protein